METQDRKVSVIMSTYNEPIEWVAAALESISNQTYKSWECIVINDNPRNSNVIDMTYDFANRDERFVVLCNSANMGLASCLNLGISKSSGEFIARMDADDVSHSDRLLKQVLFLQNNVDVDLLGTGMRLISEGGFLQGHRALPSGHELLRGLIKFKTIAFHPTWLFRKTAIVQVGGYRAFPHGAEDLDLLLRLISSGSRISNLPECLLDYRVRANGVSIMRSYALSKSRQYALKLAGERQEKGYDSFDPALLIKRCETSYLRRRLHDAAGRLELLGLKNRRSRIVSTCCLIISVILAPHKLSRYSAGVFGRLHILRYHYKLTKGGRG